VGAVELRNKTDEITYDQLLDKLHNVLQNHENAWINIYNARGKQIFTMPISKRIIGSLHLPITGSTLLAELKYGSEVEQYKLK